MFANIRKSTKQQLLHCYNHCELNLNLLKHESSPLFLAFFIFYPFKYMLLLA